ncbi:hypothetical protein [Lactococcus protaetiae]|uniref:Uncharacterized protein n=1 Tax=Lactococcus protaetiae TaxID=2592653 RepID=A0A514Z6H4_9LACT|nr:hypothetical protein [Lactococcus protaetiae]QDK70190.1 hypothetical protein FLP15_02080 [Lactococcus protaetiae]
MEANEEWAKTLAIWAGLDPKEHLKIWRENQLKENQKRAERQKNSNQEKQPNVSTFRKKQTVQFEALDFGTRKISKDKNELERLAYNQKIMAKENQTDDVMQLKNRTVERNHRLEQERYHQLSQNEELLYQISKFNPSQAERENDELQDVFSQIKNISFRQEEAQEQFTQKMRQTLQDDIDRLGAERNKLAWD